MNQLEIRTLPVRIRNGRITFPVALTPCTRVTHSRSPGWSFFRFPGFSEPVTTSRDEILPIRKPDLLKLYVSLSIIPYFAFVD